jgi:hypothetical protein
LAQGQVTRYKHIKDPDLPYMVPAVQPRLMTRVASFLLASGPLWSPPPPLRSWPPHCHLYYSPTWFLVESHLLLGCSHNIPNRASVTSELSCRGITAPSMASGLPRCNTVATNTTLGPCSQGLSSMYCPMLHLDSSLGAGTEIGGVLSTSQTLFLLQEMTL